MALSIVTNTLNGQTSPSDIFAYSQQAEWIVEVTDSLTLSGQNIYFNPAMFLPVGSPAVDNNFIPEYGYKAKVPTSLASPVQMSLIGSSPSTSSILKVEVELFASNIVRITVDFAFFADLDDYITGTSYQNALIPVKNSIDNPVISNNQYVPAVYNGLRVLRGHVIIASPTTDVIQTQLFADFKLEARYLQQGLSGGSPEFTSWKMTMERNGIEVFDLSAYEDTTITFSVNASGGLPISPVSEFVVLREDLATNTIDILQDLRMGFHTDDLLDFGIDYISSYTAWALVSGTTYESVITLDSSVVENGGTYRIAAVATNNTGLVSGSFQSTSISAEALPSLTTGTMTGTISDYNTVFPCDFLRIAQYERVKSCAKVDIASYESELSSKGLPGTFYENIGIIEVVVTNFTDGTELLRVNSRQDNPDYEIIDLFSTYESCFTFRYLPEWGFNKILHIDHIFTYNIPLPNNPYSDKVTYRQIVIAPDTEENQTSPTVTELRLFDGNLDPLREICEDTISPIIIQAVKASTVNDFNLIATIKKDNAGADIEEENGYNGNVLERLDSDLILSASVQFFGNIATFTIDDVALEEGQKYRITGIAKEVNLTPPPSCPLINVQIDTEVLSSFVSGGKDNVTIEITATITNFFPETVSSLDIGTDTLPKTIGVSQSNSFAAPTGTFNYLIAIPLPNTGSPENINTNVVVTLSNGCQYQVQLVNSVVPITGSVSSQNVNINAI